MKERVIELHNEGFQNCEICRILEFSRNKVAGIIWRYKNPGLWKKGVKSTEHQHRWPYGVKNG